MRILINALSATSGGGWTYLVNIIDELERDPRGLDFAFLVRSDLSNRLPSCGFQIIPVYYRNATHRVLYEQVRIPWIARSFDLLYCVADIAPLVKTTPTVVALRNLNIYDRRFYDNTRLKLFEHGARVGLRGARRAIFPSAAARDQISSILGLDVQRTSVVPHGIDGSRFAPAATSIGKPRVRDASRSKGIRYFLVPAAVEKHKNIEVVIDALAASADSGIEAWVAGGTDTDPDYARSLEERAHRLGVDTRFKLLGRTEYEKIAALYQGAEALVFPSLLETFGHPLLEGMSAGIPLIVSNLAVFREIAADVAWYFDPHNGSDLAKQIAQVEADAEERERRIRIGLARVESYSWKISIDRLCAIFRDVIDRESAESQVGDPQ